MTATGSRTLLSILLRKRSVLPRNNLSTIFSHEAEVGTNCISIIGCFASQCYTARCLSVA